MRFLFVASICLFLWFLVVKFGGWSRVYFVVVGSTIIGVLYRMLAFFIRH